MKPGFTEEKLAYLTDLQAKVDELLMANDAKTSDVKYLAMIFLMRALRIEHDDDGPKALYALRDMAARMQCVPADESVIQNAVGSCAFMKDESTKH